MPARHFLADVPRFPPCRRYSCSYHLCLSVWAVGGDNVPCESGEGGGAMRSLAAAAAFGFAAAAFITMQTDAGEISSVRSASGLVETRRGSGSQCEADPATSECTIL